MAISLALTGLWALKTFSGFVLGLALAVIFQEVFGYGTFGFLFVLVMSMALVLRALRALNLVNVIIFNLVWVLVGLSLKMYILMAP